MNKIKRFAAVFSVVAVAGLVTAAVMVGWWWLAPGLVAFLGATFTLSGLVFATLSILPE